MNNTQFEGMMIPGDSPMITGNWVNPKTGDFFTVSDSFFADDDMVIVTTDGRKFNYKQLNDYVCTQESAEKLKQARKTSKTQAVNEIPAELADILETDDGDNNPLNKPMPKNVRKQPNQPANRSIYAGMDADMLDDLNDIMGNLGKGAPVNQPRQSAPQYVPQYTPRPEMAAPVKPQLKDADIIERAMRRVAAPDIDLNLKFEKYPEKQIDMLVTLMGVEYDDIAAWMYEQYFSKDFKKIIIEKISKILENGDCYADEQTNWIPPFEETNPTPSNGVDETETPINDEPKAPVKKPTARKTTKRKTTKKSK